MPAPGLPQRGGILSWLGCHWLDLLCFLLDDRVTEVGALTARRNPEPIEVEDTAGLTLRFGGGVVGTLQAGYLLSGSRSGYGGALYDTYLAIRGYEGYVAWTPHTGAVTLVTAAGRQETRVDLPPSDAYGGAHGAEFVRRFLQAARAGGEPPCPAEPAAHVLAILEAAYAAAEQGKLVAVG